MIPITGLSHCLTLRHCMSVHRERRIEDAYVRASTYIKQRRPAQSLEDRGHWNRCYDDHVLTVHIENWKLKMSQFVAGLKSRQDDVRLRAARDLQRFVSTELRELPAERYGSVLDEINQSIFSLVSSPEVHEKKGGILAIGEGLGEEVAHQ